MIDLKGARDRAGLSQVDLARLLETSQSVVSRWELNPANAAFEVVVRWAAACGTDVATLMRETQRNIWRGVDPDKPYEELHRRLDLLESYVSAKQLAVAPTVKLPAGAPTAENLLALVSRWRRRPTVLIAGQFDSGKSHLANFLLGTDALPSQYTKTTKIPMFIRNLHDKPTWQAEQVWLLDSTFDPLLRDNKDHCVTHRLIAGGLDTLRSYGTYGGGDSMPPLREPPAAALVYLDSPLLHACDLVDLPGVGENDADDRKASKIIGLYDVLIYLSSVGGHLDKQDFLFLPGLIKALPAFDGAAVSRFPPLANFFLIASHAHPYVPEKSLQKIWSESPRRLFEYLKDEIWMKRNTGGTPVTEQLLRSRMFTFWEESEDRRKPFCDGFLETISRHLPADHFAQVSLQVERLKLEATTFYLKCVKAFRDGLNDLDRVRPEEAKNEEQPEKWPKRVEAARERLSNEMKEKESVALKFVDTEVKADLSDKHRILQFINKRFGSTPDPQKEAESYAFPVLIQSVESKLIDLLEEQADDINQKVNEYLEQFTRTEANGGSKVGPVRIPFDARATFAAAVAAFGSAGALTAWGTSVGSMIVTGKLVGILASLGLSTSAAASAGAVLAALGGPVGMFAGVITLGVAAYAAARQPWEVRLANRIAKVSGPNLVECSRKVTKFWQDTRENFDSSSRAMIKYYSDHDDHTRQLLIAQDAKLRQELDNTILRYEWEKSFFESIPWQ